MADEALHAAEGVAWAGVAIPAETEQMLTLLTKPPAGLFPTLDSICRTSQATDATFTTQLGQIHAGNSLFARPRSDIYSIGVGGWVGGGCA